MNGRSTGGFVFAVALLAIGLGTTFHSVMRSGFSTIPTGPEDMRLIGYLLEHGYLWISGAPSHASFWNAPFLYPLPNVTAFTETFLGAAPFYWLPRVFGVSPEVTLDLWLIQLLALDFVAFTCFTRRALGLSLYSSALGGYLFAFASIRINQLGHGQLMPHFFTLLALYGLWFMVRPRSSSRAIGVMFLSVGTAIQFYGGFYLGWFWILALTVAGAITLLLPDGRARAGIALRSVLTPAGVAAAAAGLVLIAPLAFHYFGAARELGLRGFAEVEPMIPRWRSWLNFGPAHWLYGGLYTPLVAGKLQLPWEHPIGIGIVTTIAAFAGMWPLRRHTWARIFFGTALVLVVLSISVRGYTLWQLVYHLFPAAGAIRAVTRIAVFLLIPLSVALALASERLVIGRRWLLLLCLTGLVVAEQQTVLETYAYAPLVSREQEMAAKVGSQCSAFLYTPTVARCTADEAWSAKHLRAVAAHLDAMWVSNRIGVPTLNGYTGSLPPGYPFWGLDYCGSEDDQRMPQLIESWCRDHSCNAASVCWIK